MRKFALCRLCFRKLALDGHVDLLTEIYRQLSSPRGRLDPDWMNQRIARIDDIEGDIHVLMSRIAFVRTWTYVSNHRAWIVDAEHWQARTRAVEDRLSEGRTDDIAQQIDELGRRVDELEREGRLASAGADAIRAALAELEAALG